MFCCFQQGSPVLPGSPQIHPVRHAQADAPGFVRQNEDAGSEALRFALGFWIDPGLSG